MEVKDVERIKEQYEKLYEEEGEYEADEWLDALMREIADELGYGFFHEGIIYLWTEENKFFKFWADGGVLVVKEITEDEYFTEQFIADIEAYDCKKESIRWLLKNAYKITER